MNCTACSKVVRPVVATDIDGTCGKYHQHFLSFCESYLQCSVTWDPHIDGDFSEALGIDKHTYRHVKLAYRQGGLKRSMPAYEGLEEYFAMLQMEDVERWLTTTRPYLRLDTVDPDTRFWLEQQRISYEALLYDEAKYQVLHDQVDPNRVVAILDDLPDQVIAAADLFGPAVPIFKLTPWSLPHASEIFDRGIAIARDLDEAREIIQVRLNDWNERYGSDQG